MPLPANPFAKGPNPYVVQDDDLSARGATPPQRKSNPFAIGNEDALPPRQVGGAPADPYVNNDLVSLPKGYAARGGDGRDDGRDAAFHMESGPSNAMLALEIEKLKKRESVLNNRWCVLCTMIVTFIAFVLGSFASWYVTVPLGVPMNVDENGPEVVARVGVSTLYQYPYGYSAYEGTGSWAPEKAHRLASSLNPRLSDNQAFYYDYHIYLVGGLDSTSGTGTMVSTVKIYDTLARKWLTNNPYTNTAAASMPAVRSQYGGAIDTTSGAGKIYITGGIDATYAQQSTVYVYNIQTNVWTTAAGALTTARSDHCAVYANSKLYVIGGWNAGWALTQDSVEVSSINAGATWAAETSLPAKRGDLACAVSGDKIYVFGGYYDVGENFANPAYFSTVYEGDATASPSLTWTVKTAMPTARGDMAAVTLSDGSILVIGGEQIYPGDVTKTKIAMHEVERFDPATNAWVKKAPMPAGRFRFAAAVDYNDYVHVLGGHQSCHTDDGYGSVCSSADYQFTSDQAHDVYYDTPSTTIGTGQWAAEVLTNPRTVPRLSDNVAIYYNYNIYLIGGLDSTSVTPASVRAEVHIYNTLTQVWSTGASLPAVRDRYGAALMDGKIYVMGGRDQADAAASTTYIYNIAANTWSTGGALKTARSDHCAAAANGKLYVVGGWTGAYSTLKSVEVSTNNGASWSLTTDIPEERGDVSCAASGNKVFVIGGYYDYTGAWLANSFHDDVFALDATNTEDSWYNVSSMKYARGDKAVTTLSDGSILVMGGETYYSSSASKVAMHHVERYYPIHDTWVEKAPMPRGRFRFAAAADYNDHVHVLGGHRSCHLDDGYGSVCSSADYQFEAHDAHDVFYDIDHPDLWLITRDPQIAATATV